MDRDVIRRGTELLEVPRHFASGLLYEYSHNNTAPDPGGWSFYVDTGVTFLIFSNTTANGHDAVAMMDAFWGGSISLSLASTGEVATVLGVVRGSQVGAMGHQTWRWESGVLPVSGDDGKMHIIGLEGEFTAAPAPEYITLQGDTFDRGRVEFMHKYNDDDGVVILRPKVSPTTTRTIELPDKDGDVVVIPSPTTGDILYFNGTDWEKLPKESDGDILQLSGGFPAWVAPPSAIPVASVMPYAGTTAPTDWMLCYGQAISRTTYAALFAAVSTTYGAGDGSTTFNLPDLRGRVVAGKDNMGGSAANRITNAASGITGTTLGANGGEQTHTLITAEMPAHNHPITSNIFTALSTTGGGQNYQATSGPRLFAASTFGSTNTGGDAPHRNVQPTMILNHIIRVNP